MAQDDGILKEIRAKMDENQKLLREIARWSRFQNIGKLKEVLAAELDTEAKKLAFESSDDTKGIKEIAQVCGAPQDTVYSWWKRWSRLGVLEPSRSREGRLVRICSLEDVGIKMPKAAHREEKSGEEKVTEPGKTTEEKIVGAEDASLSDKRQPEEVSK